MLFRSRQVGKACWLALVLETEYGFRRRSINLRRTMLEGTRDLATIEIELEGNHGNAGEEHGYQ